jgi:hypothetical protein
MRRIIYLAGPYSHPDPSVRERRFDALTNAAADLAAQGHIVFSPITHCHPIDVLLSEPRDSDYWCAFVEPFMAACSEMLILPLDGWQESVGVMHERAFFEARGLPVNVL